MYNPDIHSVRSGNMFTLTLTTPAPEKEGSGSMDYNNLTNKPAINDIELSGNLTLEDLGLGGVPTSALLPEELDSIIGI